MKAFILAAGHGSRMRPYTDNCPKPLLEINGESMLKRTLFQLKDVQVDEAVVNNHYCGEMVPEHLKDWEHQKITHSHEPDLLDTGGGIVNCLDQFDDAFWVSSGDSYIEDHSKGYHQLDQFWNSEIMDILILLQPIASMTLTRGVGDYQLKTSGQAVRSHDKSGTHMFTSLRINHPRIFEGREKGEVFSYLELLDEAETKGRLYATEHDGTWHHISTPTDLDAVRAQQEQKRTA